MSADSHFRVSGEAKDPFWSFIMSQVRPSAHDDVGAQMLETGLSHEDLVDSLIEAALKRSGGNVSEAARAIGMSRSQVNYWRRKRQ